MATIRNYRVTATGNTGQHERCLMEVDVSAANAKQAISTARKRSEEYFDRTDFIKGTLRWNARATEV